MRPIKTRDGRRFLIQSKSFLEYESDVLSQIDDIKDELKIENPISCPVNMKCVYYRGDKRKCDLLNLLNATADILVKAQILEDDNYKILISTDGSRVFYDADRPRVEINITERAD